MIGGKVKLVLLIIIAAMFSGCVAEHNFDIKRVKNYSSQQINYQLGDIRVKVASSDKKTGYLDAINNSVIISFKDSLSNAIDDSNLFSVASPNEVSLNAIILKNAAPRSRVAMKVDSEILYEVKNKKNDLLYSKIISSSAMLKNDGFAAKRIMLAMDRALKKNIVLFLEDISNNLGNPKTEIEPTKIQQNDDWR